LAGDWAATGPTKLPATEVVYYATFDVNILQPFTRRHGIEAMQHLCELRLGLRHKDVKDVRHNLLNSTRLILKKEKPRLYSPEEQTIIKDSAKTFVSFLNQPWTKKKRVKMKDPLITCHECTLEDGQTYCHVEMPHVRANSWEVTAFLWNFESTVFHPAGDGGELVRRVVKRVNGRVSSTRIRNPWGGTFIANAPCARRIRS
jgi:hypothetical protein